MAAGVVGGAFVGAKALFAYNKKNFMLDRKLKQDRVYQEQKMKIEQFSLYREDVRDLVELTTSKMDLYMVVGALLVDKTMMMICKENDALPPGSPEWAVALNSLSLASAVFYFLLCLWLAMYASVSAQSFGTRLLTQFVRLPVATKEQIESASAQAIDYEASNITDVLRIPIIMAQRGDPTDADPSTRGGNIWLERNEASIEEDHSTQVSTFMGAGASSSADGSAPPAGAEDQDADGTNILPTAMLNHIRLYRKVQLNWQAFDAYARVSLFVGTNCLLYSCLYWSLGQLLQNQHATVPALGVSCIFATVQMLISRLDLRLRRKEVAAIGILLAATPTITTIALLQHLGIVEELKKGHEVALWRKMLMGLLAVVAHALHAVVMFLILAASWPDEACVDGADAALLPGKFRSTLYLDVFGWLMNPGGPGPTATGEVAAAGSGSMTGDRHDAGDSDPRSGYDSPTPSSPAPSRSPSPSRTVSEERWEAPSGSSTPRSRSSRRSRIGSALQRLPSHSRRERIGLSVDLEAETRSLFSPTGSGVGSPNPNGTRRRETEEIADRWGGREAASLDIMDRINRASVANAASFAPSPDRDARPQERPRDVGKKASVPGEIPWRAFAQGTLLVTALWTVSTLWALSHVLSGRGWKSDLSENKAGDPEKFLPEWISGARLLELSNGTLPQLQAACAAGHGPLLLRQRSAGAAEIVMSSAPLGQLNVSDQSCNLRRPVQDLALVCHDGSDLASGRCLALLLRRGGRTVSACRLVHRNDRYRLLGLASLRLVPGVPALRTLAAAYHPQRKLQESPDHQFADLQIFARTDTGALVAFQAVPDARYVAGADAESAPFSVMRRWCIRPQFEITPAMSNSKSCAADSSDSDSGRLFVVGLSLLSLAPRESSAECCDLVDSCRNSREQDNRLVLQTWDISTGEYTVHRLQEWHQWAWNAAAVLRALCAPWARS